MWLGYTLGRNAVLPGCFYCSFLIKAKSPKTLMTKNIFYFNSSSLFPLDELSQYGSPRQKTRAPIKIISSVLFKLLNIVLEKELYCAFLLHIII